MGKLTVKTRNDNGKDKHVLLIYGAVVGILSGKKPYMVSLRVINDKRSFDPEANWHWTTIVSNVKPTNLTKAKELINDTFLGAIEKRYKLKEV